VTTSFDPEFLSPIGLRTGAQPFLMGEERWTSVGVVE
jgi:hypothetical protein